MGRKANLTKEERLVIQLDLKHGFSPAEIARKLGRHRGTIGKEIKLNYDPAFKEYNYLVADNMAKKRMSDSRQLSYKINKIPKEILNKLFNDFMGTKELGVQESAITLHKDEGYKISYGSIYRHIERPLGKRESA